MGWLELIKEKRIKQRSINGQLFPGRQFICNRLWSIVV